MLGAQGLRKRLPKRVGARVRAAAWTAHLGEAPPVRPGTEQQNARPGQGQKTVQTDTGPWDRVVPRARPGSVAPQLGPKRQRRVAGCDDQVWSR